MKEVKDLDWIMETERLQLRCMTLADRDIISNILKDAETMYAWEHGFSDQEVDEWMERNLARYRQEGHSFWLAFDKNSAEFIGHVGLITENILQQDYLGIGYILDKKYWGQGYALEAAKACAEYAFDKLGRERVIAQIRLNNLRSRSVAEKLGMQVAFEYTKVYQGKDMPHLVYTLFKAKD